MQFLFYVLGEEVVSTSITAFLVHTIHEGMHLAELWISMQLDRDRYF